MNQNLFSIAVCCYATVVLGLLMAASVWPDERAYAMALVSLVALVIAICATLDCRQS